MLQVLLSGVDANPGIWDLISGIKSGEKGDLRFVKDLALVGFGPEVLSSCSIKGTKRGQKKDGEKTARPPLNPNMLKQIYGMFVLCTLVHLP